MDDKQGNLEIDWDTADKHGDSSFRLQEYTH